MVRAFDVAEFPALLAGQVTIVLEQDEAAPLDLATGASTSSTELAQDRASHCVERIDGQPLDVESVVDDLGVWQPLLDGLAVAA